MYESFFGLRCAPFSLSPDPLFLWPSETHQEGLSALIYGISRRKGFILLTGEVGSGKTTLLRTALERLGDDLPETAMVMNTAGLTSLDLLKLIVVEFRLVSASEVARESRSLADYLVVLDAFLLERMSRDESTVLIIDEAQNLGLEALEQVRLLSNYETHTEKSLQIVLTGQPELREKLADPRLRQLRQRIAIEHHIEPLRRAETLEYLSHRIARAGGRFAEIFGEGVDRAFADFADGCPRLLNLLADRVLLAAYSKSLRPIPASFVELKAKDMGHIRPEPAPTARTL